MDEFADAVHVVEADEQLSRDFAHNWDGDAAVVVLLNEGEHVLSQHLEHHREVPPVEPVVIKPVIHLEAVGVFSRWDQ